MSEKVERQIHFGRADIEPGGYVGGGKTGRG
jgi:hypothetical protein